MKEQQWRNRSDLGNVELVKVVGMKYEIRPPRLCCLKLAVINQETNQLTGQKFSIKYHDMEDVVDFLVLRHLYDASVDVTWTTGDRYRYKRILYNKYLWEALKKCIIFNIRKGVVIPLKAKEFRTSKSTLLFSSTTFL